MSVWYVLPSKRQPQEAMAVLDHWVRRGYRVLVMRDQGDAPLPGCQNVFAAYPGYGAAVNLLAKMAFTTDPNCQWVVTGGDDYLPDAVRNPETMARECSMHFATLCKVSGIMVPGSFGVMQPTGDRWMLDENGKSPSEKVCDAPWLGREFCQRMYQGTGPYHPYQHFFVDEELHEVATKLGVLWHRPDIVQVHRHWSRLGEPKPDFLKNKDWENARLLFLQRREQGFPGHQPLMEGM